MMTNTTGDIAKILGDIVLADEVQFALIGALSEAVGKLLTEHDPDAALAFVERIRMATEVLDKGNS